MTRRAGCTPAQVVAHRILDRVRDGEEIPAVHVTRALSLLGDIE